MFFVGASQMSFLYGWCLAESADDARRQASDHPERLIADDNEFGALDVDEVRPATPEELASDEVRHFAATLVEEEFLAAHRDELRREIDRLVGVADQAQSTAADPAA
jgi:hypothetical protein